LAIVLSTPCMMFANMIEAVIQPRLGTAAGVSPRKSSYPDGPASL
jgi:hypothetical protein